jgi:integrase
MIETNLIIRKNRKSKNIYLRIKVNGAKLVEVSSGLYCKPSQWHSKDWCKTTGKMSQEDREHNIRTNMLLKEATQGYVNAWDKLHGLGQRVITVADLKSFINGTHELAINRDRRLTFSEAVDIFIEWKEPKVKSTAPHRSILNLAARVLTELDKADITIDNFTARVASELLNYLLKTKFVHNGITKNYAYNTRSALRTTCKELFDYFYKHEDLLSYKPVLPKSHPFQYVKVEKLKIEKDAIALREVHYYSNEEIEQIENVKLSPMLEYYRNVLLFQIYTGISYVDVSEFDPDINLVDEGEGGYWISNRRVKTKVEFNVPVGKNALKLIDYFLHNKHIPNASPGNGIIRTGSFCTYFNQLKKVGDVIGLKLTQSHKARHTFAMQMLNKNLCSFQEVAAMLGHKNIDTTQESYAVTTREFLIRKQKIRDGKHLTVTKSTMTGTH